MLESATDTNSKDDKGNRRLSSGEVIPTENWRDPGVDKGRFVELPNQQLCAMEVSMKHVYIIDDDEEIRTHLGIFLQDLGYRVTLFGSSETALNGLQEQ